jgi:hypothetical protein
MIAHVLIYNDESHKAIYFFSNNLITVSDLSNFFYSKRTLVYRKPLPVPVIFTGCILKWIYAN